MSDTSDVNINTRINFIENGAQQVIDAAQKVKSAITSIGSSASSGANIDFGAKKLDEQRAAIDAYKRQLSSLGDAFSGKSKSIGDISANVSTVYQAFKNANSAGIATANTMTVLGANAGKATGETTSFFQNIRIGAATAQASLASLGDAYLNSGRQAAFQGKTMMASISLPLAAIATQGVRTFESFNSQMIQLKRVTQYKEDYGLFKKEIDQLSNSFGLSTNAAAGLMTEVAALGMHGSDINKMATEVGKFAMVTQTDAQTSLELYRKVMTVFGGGSIDKTTEIMAQLSAIVDDTALRMDDLTSGLPQIAPLMKTMGFSAAGTAAAMASMATQGIDASEGASALKIVLMKLDDPTKKINRVIQDLGISFFDMSGKAEDGNQRLAAAAVQFTNMNAASQTKIVSELGPRQGPRILAMLQDMSRGVKELNTVTADGIVTQDEADAVQSGWAKAMLASGQVTGYTAKTLDRYNEAAKQIQKDPGTGLKVMRTQFSQISRDIGDVVAPAFISVGHFLSNIIQLFGKLPKPIQQAVIGFGALVAAVGPMRYVFGSIKSLIGAVSSGISMVMPQMTELTVAQRELLLASNANRTDVLFAGNTARFAGGKRATRSALREANKDVAGTEGAGITASSTAAEGSITQASTVAQTSLDKLTLGLQELSAETKNWATSTAESTTIVQTKTEISANAMDAAYAKSMESLQIATAAQKVEYTQIAEAAQASAAERIAAEKMVVEQQLASMEQMSLTNAGYARQEAAVRTLYSEQAAASLEISAAQKKASATYFNPATNRFHYVETNKMAKTSNVVGTEEQKAAEEAEIQLAAARKAESAALAEETNFLLDYQAEIIKTVAETSNLINVDEALRNMMLSLTTEIGYWDAANQSLIESEFGLNTEMSALEKTIENTIAWRKASIPGLIEEENALNASGAGFAELAMYMQEVKTQMETMAAETTNNAYLFDVLSVSQNAAAESTQMLAASMNMTEESLISMAAELEVTKEEFISMMAPTALTEEAFVTLAATMQALDGVILETAAGNVLLEGTLTGVAATAQEASIAADEMGASFLSAFTIGSGGTILLIVAAIAAVVGIVLYLKSNWNSLVNTMQPGIDALKSAFNSLKEAFGNIAKGMGDVFSQLTGGTTAVDGSTNSFSGLGAILNWLTDQFATATQFIANAINFLKPVFIALAYIIKDMVAFVADLINGDWSKAWQAFIAIGYEIVRPVLILVQQIARPFAWLFDKITGFSSAIASALGLSGLAKSLDKTGKELNSFANDPGWINSMDDHYRKGIGDLFGPAGPVAEKKPDAKKAGDDLGGAVADGLNNATGDAGKSWVKNWITSVYSELDKEKSKITSQANKAMDDANKKEQKAFDLKSKNIDETIKDEERLYQTQQYLQKKKEMLDQRDIDIANYKKDRAKAIYEGRYNDVRMMDLERQKGTIDFNKNLKDLEDQRAKDLLGINRTDLKQRITDEKQAAQEAYDIRKASFDDALALITSYSPATEAEFQTMLDSINDLIKANGAAWPEYGKTAATRLAEVFKKANDDALETYRKSGQDAATAWMEGQATAQTIAALTALNNSGNTGTPGNVGGVTTGANTDNTDIASILQNSTDEQKIAFQTFIDAQNNMNTTPITQDQLAAWVGSGAGLGSPSESGSTKIPQSVIDQQAQAAANSFGFNVDVSNVLHNNDLDSQTRLFVDTIKQQIRSGNYAMRGQDGWAAAMSEIASEDREVARSGKAMSDTDWLRNYAMQKEIDQRKKDEEERHKNAEENNTAVKNNTEDVVNRHSSYWVDQIAEIKRLTETTDEAIARSTMSANQNIGKALGNTTRSMKTFTDSSGKMWFDMDGQIVDGFGHTATFTQDQSDRTKGVLVDNMKNVLTASIDTFTGGQKVVDYMNKQGLDPASTKAQFFKDRLNEVGGVVKELDGKSLYIDLNMGNEDFWTKFDTLNAWTKTFEGEKAIAAMAGNTLYEQDGRYMMRYGTEANAIVRDVTSELGPLRHITPKASGGLYSATVGAFKMAMGGMVQYAGGGSLVKNRKNGILANIGEGGFDEYVITTDPKYRAQNIAYMASAASKLGISMSALRARSAVGAGYAVTGGSASGGSGGSGGSYGGDVHISVDTFIGEEQWFAEMANKYNMTIVPRQRKIEGQQKRVVSSYNNRWSLK